MKPELQIIYDEKLTTAAEAVKMIRSGDRVYGGTASSWAYGLLQALWDRRHELEGVTILGSNAYQAAPIFDEDEDNPFLFSTFFVGVNDRKQMKRLDYTSVHLSLVDYWSETEGRPDVCLLEVSPPDEDGSAAVDELEARKTGDVKTREGTMRMKANMQRDGEALRITRGDRECQPKVFLFKQEG